MKSCCVILAAGLSSRMGRFKPLLPIEGRPAIVHLIHTLQSAGVDECIIVTGHRAEEIEQACHSVKKVSFVHNPDYATTGMFESAKIGFGAVASDCTRVLFTPADIPLIPKEIVKTLLANNEPLIYPSYQYHKGHPVILDADLLSRVLAFEGKGGLRGALASLPVEPSYLVTDDPRILMDMDTPEDYQAIVSESEKHI